MPPRRSHTKSKAGCQRCKNRKIKCDEVHPVCGNCNKHGVSCDFDGSAVHSPSLHTHHSQYSQNSINGTPPRNPSIASITSPGTSSVVPFYRSPIDFMRSGSDTAAIRMLDLRLMHHYTAFVAETLCSSKSERIAWQQGVPLLAYDAPYLMDTILAVSALHLRTLCPNDYSLTRACHGYMASSLAQYSSILGNRAVSERNAEALFCTAALIAFQSAASRRFEEADNQYVVPVSWFHSFQGIKTVVFESWQWIRNSDTINAIINSQPALNLDLDPSHKTFFAPLLEGMDLQLEMESDSTSADTRHAYVHAVACLNWAHQKPDRGRILAFAATVSRRFVDLLAAHDPRALTIVACFFAMLKSEDDVWWLNGVAKKEVMGIFTLLPPEWWGRLEWPIRICNHEGPFDDEVWGITDPVKQEPMESQINFHIDFLRDLMSVGAPTVPVD